MFNSFYRKIGFGIGPNDNIPSNPIAWANKQVETVSEFSWKGWIPKENETREKYGEYVFQDRKVLRKKYKNNLEGYEQAKNILRNKTGERFFEANELVIRHNEAIKGTNPVFERFWHFWGNHFAISEKDLLAHFSVGPYQREIIRPNMIKTFEEMLLAVTTSWCMIHHLDNSESVGPNSKRGIQSRKTINENHARELLELHTVSPAAGYTQDDVIQLCYIMTGWEHKWSRSRQETGDIWFNFETHQPGDKVVLGKKYKNESKQELYKVIHNLSNHPACKKFIAEKLCRHFITDYPTEDMIKPIINAWNLSGGYLPAIHKAVIKSTFDFGKKHNKFQSPETWILQLNRIFGSWWIPKPEQMKYNFKFKPRDNQRKIEWVLEEIGHLPYRPKQPNGWPDLEEDWLSPELLIRRLIFAKKISQLGIKRTDEFIAMVIEKNFDNPQEILNRIKINKVNKDKIHSNIYGALTCIIANSPEMLKA